MLDNINYQANKTLTNKQNKKKIKQKWKKGTKPAIGIITNKMMIEIELSYLMPKGPV